MTIEDIQRLVAADESRHLELKKTTGELKDGMHSACAFLNTEGGWLIFGVHPTSKRIEGQNVSDSTQREIANALSGIEPSVYIPVEYIDVPNSDDKKVIAMHFDGWAEGLLPFTFHGRPYIKIESTTKVMPRDMFEERIKLHKPNTHQWEKEASDRSLDALNHDRIRGSVRMGVDGGRLPESVLSETIQNILMKSELLTDGKPNNGAVMLFANDTFGYPQLKLRMARFVGTNKDEFIDNQQVKGNFFDLLDAGMAFFFKHLNLSGVIKGLQREEKLEIPVAALREALINALCHRQYEKHNLTIGIAIFDDRVEISNPGLLPPQITPETIKFPHDSYPYNPAIAEFLFRTTWLENWGSGAHRIMTACASHGVAEPVWEVRGGFVVVTFSRPTVKPTTTVPPQHHHSTTTAQQLLDVLGDKEMSRLEIMVALGLNNKNHFIKSYLKPALEADLIEPIYPDQPKHPKQKYRRKN